MTVWIRLDEIAISECRLLIITESPRNTPTLSDVITRSLTETKITAEWKANWSILDCSRL